MVHCSVCVIIRWNDTEVKVVNSKHLNYCNCLAVVPNVGGGTPLLSTINCNIRSDGVPSQKWKLNVNESKKKKRKYFKTQSGPIVEKFGENTLWNSVRRFSNLPCCKKKVKQRQLSLWVRRISAQITTTTTRFSFLLLHLLFIYCHLLVSTRGVISQDYLQQVFPLGVREHEFHLIYFLW